MDAKELPAHPKLKRYEKLAEDLLNAHNKADSEALQRIRDHYSLDRPPTLEEVRVRIAQRLRRLRNTEDPIIDLAPGDAQLVVADSYGFESWSSLADYIEAINQKGSLVSKFEAAVDAVINGDAAALERLLRETPELIRTRSTRTHHATLLHYVSANGVEDFRQKTPRNIVEITELLLKAGANVNAESDAYGGGSTTLGLTATSWHPQNAGVQLPLMELLIDHGAIIDGPDGGSAVNGCLANGRGEAAEFLAQHGARLDLEGAAGVGRLDLVKSFFNDDGSLKTSATKEQMESGFAWACEFGRRSVAEFLLVSGLDVDTRLRHDGQTGLHSAAIGGRSATVKLLLERGASVDVKDKSYSGTPLEWALYGWGLSASKDTRDDYYDVVALLVDAGATVAQQWIADSDRETLVEKVRADPRLLAALRGQIPVS